MTIKVASSSLENINEAVNELKNQFDNFDPKIVIFFCSSNYNSDKIALEVHNCFDGAQTFGCTTAGEIVSGKMLKNSIVAMGFDEETIADCKISIMENIKENSNTDFSFNEFENHYNKKAHEFEHDKYVGIALFDGLSMAEERIINDLGNKSNLIFIGGSAGDDVKFKQTDIFANGKSYTNVALLAILKPNVKFSFIKTQSFEVLDKVLKATKVDVKNREVIEFNNRPAKEVYCEAIGQSESEAENYYSINPIGLLSGDEVFVRGPQKFVDNKMKFYCNILENTETKLLKCSNTIVKDTKEAIQKNKDEMGQISGIIDFHCMQRTLELERFNQKNDYGKIYEDIPTIGFSTYGECFLGHVNITSTILVFN